MKVRPFFSHQRRHSSRRISYSFTGKILALLKKTAGRIPSRSMYSMIAPLQGAQQAWRRIFRSSPPGISCFSGICAFFWLMRLLFSAGGSGTSAPRGHSEQKYKYSLRIPRPAARVSQNTPQEPAGPRSPSPPIRTGLFMLHTYALPVPNRICHLPNCIHPLSNRICHPSKPHPPPSKTVSATLPICILPLQTASVTLPNCSRRPGFTDGKSVFGRFCSRRPN